MPGLNGVDSAAQITRRSRRTGVIILSMYSDEEYLERAVAAGVPGYLLKDAAEPDLVCAVRAGADGKTFFSPAISDKLFGEDALRLQQSKRAAREPSRSDGRATNSQNLQLRDLRSSQSTQATG